MRHATLLRQSWAMVEACWSKQMGLCWRFGVCSVVNHFHGLIAVVKYLLLLSDLFYVASNVNVSCCDGKKGKKWGKNMLVGQKHWNSMSSCPYQRKIPNLDRFHQSSPKTWIDLPSQPSVMCAFVLCHEVYINGFVMFCLRLLVLQHVPNKPLVYQIAPTVLVYRHIL